MIDARVNAFVVFRDVAEKLYERINKRNPIQTFNEMIAFVVNGSLACELGFKAIISREFDECKKHDLYELFEMLDIETKRKIKLNLPTLIDKSDDSNEFDELLKKVSNNFIEWRYYYEKDLKTNWLFIFELMESLSAYFGLKTNLNIYK